MASSHQAIKPSTKRRKETAILIRSIRISEKKERNGGIGDPNQIIDNSIIVSPASQGVGDPVTESDIGLDFVTVLG